jgi:hypothetical protein
LGDFDPAVDAGREIVKTSVQLFHEQFQARDEFSSWGRYALQ